MEIELAIEVREVAFEEFERRKSPRKNISVIEIQNKAFFEQVFNEPKDSQTLLDSGIVVKELSLDEFKHY